MLEVGKRYKKVDGVYIESDKGQYLGKRGPGGTTGVMDLGVKTLLGYPVDDKTDLPYINEGFDPNEVDREESEIPIPEPDFGSVVCAKCGKDPCECEVLKDTPVEVIRAEGPEEK